MAITKIDIPEGYQLYEENIMSNFDHKIDADIVNKCMKENIVAQYPGWNFFARVW